jgi:hypothetical protein
MENGTPPPTPRRPDLGTYAGMIAGFILSVGLLVMVAKGLWPR